MASERQAALTSAQCAAAFIAVKENEWKNAKYGEQWRTTLETCFLPIIHLKNVLSRRDAKPVARIARARGFGYAKTGSLASRYMFPSANSGP